MKHQNTENRKFDSKTRNSGSPRKYDKSKDSKNDPFTATVVEKRFVIDDEDNNVVYEYDSPHNELNQKNIRNNSTQLSKNSQNSHNKNSPRSQLSPRKKKIEQKIMKLEAELRDLQSSVISGMTNENSESLHDVDQKIDAKKRKLDELEKLAELERRESKEENENKELRRRIEILEKNQKEMLSPKSKPNLGFMSPHDAIISIKATPFDQQNEGSSLIKRRKQDPINVEVSNKKSSKKNEKQQYKEKEISLSSEKKLNESSFCQMNPIDAKNFADKHMENIVSSDAKKYSSHPISKNLSSHHESDQKHSNYKSNTPTRKQNESSKHPKSQTSQKRHHRDSEQEKYQNYSSNNSSKHQPLRKQNTTKSEKPNVVTRSIDIPEDDQDLDRDLSVDVTIVEVKKIPDASLYCVIFTEAHKDSASKTKVANRETDSNIINEDFHFEFNQSVPKSAVLAVIVKREDLIKGDKIIGSVKIDLNAVIRSMNRKKVNVLDKIFPILAESKIQTEGRLHLILRSDCVNFTEDHRRSTKKPKKEKQAKKKLSENKVERTQKTPSVSDNKSNSINEENVKERDQQLEPADIEIDQQKAYSEEQLKQSEEEKHLSENSNSSQIKENNSYSSKVKDRKSNSSKVKDQRSNSSQIQEQNSYSSQAKDSNSGQKQKPRQVDDAVKSPKSPKYNWNNGSLITKSNKKKTPIYELLSEDEEEERKENEQDTYDENAPALNPSSFPLPTIKYSASVEEGIVKENDMKDQMTLSLQDILERTGSPVREREVDFPFGNDSIVEEEEEENESDEDLIGVSDTPIEPVSEDEDQINNRLDKKFGKEPPRLSSAEPSEIECNINKSQDAVTFNLGNLVKYYEPRFLDTVPQQRRNERKQKQQLMERSVPLLDESEEDDKDKIEAEFESNLNAMKKKQRITKVPSNDELLDSDDNDVQIGVLPINDDDDDDNEKDNKNENESSDNQIKTREPLQLKEEEENEKKDEEENENEKKNAEKQKEEEDDDDIINSHLSESNSNEDDDENKSKSEADTEKIDPLNLDLFLSSNENKPNDDFNNPKKTNTNEKFDQIEKVESSNATKNPSKLNYSSNSGISLTGDASSFTESSFKSSLSQIRFVDSVKKIDEQHRKFSDDNVEEEESA